MEVVRVNQLIIMAYVIQNRSYVAIVYHVIEWLIYLLIDSAVALISASIG